MNDVINRESLAYMQRSAGGRLRVALFTGNYNYIKDGVALSLNRLVRYLQEQDIPVITFAPTGPMPAFEPAGELVSVPSLPIPLRPEYRISLGLPRAARERLEAFKPTLFHIAVPDVLGYRALKLAGEWNIPAVASFHTRYDTYLKFYGLGFLETHGRKYLRYFYNQCQHVYPPSQCMATILREEGIARDMRIWSRGVDGGLFSPAKRSLEWRRSLGIADHEIVVVYVGRLVKEKNTALLAKVLNSLRQHGMPFRSLIVGDGPERAAMKAALPHAVFAGFLHGEDLARAYASSDIFLFPSESETFGNVTLEAMACGLPALCANATGSRSLVVDGKTGFLTPNNREAEFVSRLGTLIADDELRKEMAAAGRARALDFSWDSVLATLVGNYHEATATAPVLAAEPVAPLDYGVAEPGSQALRT